MLKLTDIRKSYLSKSKQETLALKGINLEFSSAGLVFLLGKSGSGKSTLLNIIGGLDDASKGEISYQNQTILHDEKALDDYRNNTVGFVFQEFNLLEDFTVLENIAIATKLQDNSDQKVIIDSLTRVGLSGYENRYPSELSGGQKQRVAVARALVKNSKILLADEPTGNLDSETGAEIFELLKSISSEKLVIIVSHDRENAEHYADRIIEIKDGLIVTDTIRTKHEGSSDITDEKAPLKRAKFPAKFAFKMGLSNIGRKKARNIITIILCFLFVFSVGFSYSILSFSAEKSIAKTAYDNDVDYLALHWDGTKYAGLNESVYNNLFKKNDYSFIMFRGNYGIIETEEDLSVLDMGLYSSVPLTDTNMFVTDLWLDSLNTYKNPEVFINNDWVSYQDSNLSYADLAGKTIRAIDFGGIKEYQIAGVLNTTSKPKNNLDQYSELFFCKEGFVVNEGLRTYLHYYENSNRLPVENKNYYNRFTVNTADTKTYSFSEYRLFGQYPAEILTSDAQVDLYQMELADDEIVLSMDVYEKHFGVDLNYEDFYQGSEGDFEVIKYPSEELKNKTIEVQVHNNDINQTLINKSFKIVGLQMHSQKPQPFSPVYQPDLSFYFPNTTYLKISKYGFINTNSFLGLSTNWRADAKLLRALRNDYGIQTSFAYSHSIFEFEGARNMTGQILIIFGVILLIICILTTSTLISQSINDRRKEIGILRALGARKQDIMKIYLFQTLFMAAIIFVLGLIFTIGAVLLMNYLLASATMAGITFIMFSGWTVLILIALSFLCLGLPALLTLQKISKMKPVDAIKNN